MSEFVLVTETIIVKVISGMFFQDSLRLDISSQLGMWDEIWENLGSVPFRISYNNNTVEKITKICANWIVEIP